MAACLEESRGVSAHIVQLLEDEWIDEQRSLVSDLSDALDLLNVLLVQLEIQQFHMLPLPNYDPEAVKRNILKAYSTAQTIIRNMMEIDRQTDFLLHAPQFYFRGLVCAICTICKVMRSSYKNFLDRKQLEQSAADMLVMTKKSILIGGDLATRISSLLEPWLPMAIEPEWDEEPVSSFTRRLSASPTLDCLVRWKRDQELLLGSKTQPPPPNGANGSAVAASVDPMQFIDWGFTDDFDWNFESNILSSGA